MDYDLKLLSFIYLFIFGCFSVGWLVCLFEFFLGGLVVVRIMSLSF